MIAYDLDGVICEEYKWLNSLFKINSYIAVFVRSHYAKVKFRPRFNDMIITGRPECDLWKTRQWLNKNNIPTAMLITNRNFGVINSAEYKARAILEQGVNIYIESDSLQAEDIRSMVGDKAYILLLDEMGMHELERFFILGSNNDEILIKAKGPGILQKIFGGQGKVKG